MGKLHDDGSWGSCVFDAPEDVPVKSRSIAGSILFPFP